MNDATPPVAPVPADTFTPGEVVAKRYRIVRRLGRGGMGEVYEAIDAELSERIAMKTVRSSADRSFATDVRLVQELQLARRISHPNVCRLYHIDRDQREGGDVLFLTMELLEGGTLANRLAGARALEPAEGELIARQLAAAMGAAHGEGIIHRDLKPSNIMFGSHGRVVITDFGLARLQPAQDATTRTVSQPVGTVAYMAPELLSGGRASVASDVYAFGVVLHEMMTGRHPVPDDRSGGMAPPSALAPEVQPVWDAIILGCLVRDPGKRFQSAEAALTLLGSGDPPLGHRRSVAWRPGPIVGGVVAASALVGWLAWAWFDVLLHPLPPQRFVALMAWPSSPDDPNLPLVRNALDAISSQLSRAEVSGSALMVISSSDVNGLGALTAPTEAVRALGANLVFTAALRSIGEDAVLDLAVLEAVSGRILRRREVHLTRAEFGRIPERAAATAAELLDVPVTKGRWSDQDELATVPAAAYQLFTQAEDFAAQSNDSGLDQAIEHYQKALEAHRTFAFAHARLSLAHSRKFDRFRDPADLSLGQRNADLAMRYNTHSINGVLARATVQLYSGHVVDALSGIQAGLDSDPGNPQLLIAKARAFRYLNRADDEEQTYRELIRNRPNFWPAYNELGLLLFRQAKYREAATAFAEGSSVAPRVARLLNNLGAMQLSMKRGTEAEATFRRSAELTPTETAYNNLGTIAFGAGRYQEALAFYERARDLNPRSDVVWRNIGDCYTMLGQPALERASYARAAELAAQVLAINGKRGPIWMQLAFYQAKLGRQQDAEKALEAADANGASDLQSQFRKAQVLVLLGRRSEALEMVLTCLDRGLAPADVELALDLKDLRTDPQYLNRAQQVARK